jgi:hypothetical protein
MERIPASERTRERLKGLMAGDGGASDVCSQPVRLAARLIIEDAPKGEAADALGRGSYTRGAGAGGGLWQRLPDDAAEERLGIDRV